MIAHFSHHQVSIIFNLISGSSFAFFFFNSFMNITFLLDLLGHLKFMGMMALSRLRPLNLPEQDHQTEEDHATSSTYVLVMDGSSPSLVPVDTLMALIKKRVPVIEYSNFVERYEVEHDQMVAACSVCLNSIERSHEIRVLTNSCHVFHRDCLDRWVDEVQLTCPLCRTVLLPDSCGLGKIIR